MLVNPPIRQSANPLIRQSANSSPPLIIFSSRLPKDVFSLRPLYAGNQQVIHSDYYVLDATIKNLVLCIA